jgi:hypothetical protein
MPIGPFTIVAIYIVCWWTVLFAVLPLGMSQQGQERPTDGAQWAKITGDFAGRLEKLGTKASDKKLKKVLTDFAGSGRKASPEIAQNGDVAQMTVLLRDQPGQLGRACS